MDLELQHRVVLVTGASNEMAQVASFLASDRASYVTPAIVPMGGASNPPP